MPNLWLASTDGADWDVAPLVGNAYGLSAGGISAVGDLGGDKPFAGQSVALVRHGNNSPEQWSLLARNGTNVRVNGSPVVLGIRVLSDRDEITVRADAPAGSLRCFYSAERLAEVVAFPGGGTVRCPRCKQPIRQGQMAVQCPSADCGAWHHQSPELPCWTYSVSCALCPQPTELGGGFRWTPEEL